ncbi:MAG: galactokinase family protein [Oscillospiraceae bacterium]|nr:galactokinase family protein [Oscillospiraceae bacterium]
MALFNSMKTLLEEKKLGDGFSQVYLPDRYDEQYERFLDVLSDFGEYFDKNEEREVSLFSAPGRSEVCGNHTDHNHGRVLAAGISLDAIAVASPNDTGVVSIKSKGYPMDVISCDELEVDEKNFGKSSELIRGILSRFKQLGYNIGGFDATTASKVLSGSGLSSSAAFEVLVCTILNHLYNDGKIDPVEIAQISQYAENVYFGKPCGLLDQMACSVGGFVTIDFNDPSKPIIKKVDFDFASCGHSLCIVDTKGDHSDLTDEYAAVRAEMEAVAAFFGKKVLRELDKQTVIENAADIRAAVSDRAVLRAIHFFNDDERVVKEVEALENGDFGQFKKLTIESGRSSYMYNQNVYACSAPLSQPLSLALAVSEELLKGKGAWRVHGGGFAGTIQAFVPNEMLDEYKNTMNSIFGDDACYVLSIRPMGGAKLG